MISLPEERALLGQGQGQHIEPISLDSADDDSTRQRQQAQRILDVGGRFDSDDLHVLVARFVLGV